MRWPHRSNSPRDVVGSENGLVELFVADIGHREVKGLHVAAAVVDEHHADGGHVQLSLQG